MMKMKKNILIIGSGGGIGNQLVEKLNKDIYNLITPTSKELDITNPIDVNLFFESNNIDILINLAGKKSDFLLSEQNKYQEYKEMVDVNIIGTLNLLSGCLPGMQKRNYGRVILMSSVFAEMNVPKQGVYSATKSFSDKIVKNVSLENIKYGITANTIQLGFFEGGMGLKTTKENIERAKDKIGLKRFINIGEIVNTIDFIIETEYLTGQNIKIDGGIR